MSTPTITPATTQTVTYPQTTSTTLTATSNSTGALTYYLSTSGATSFGNASITTISSTNVVSGKRWVAVGQGPIVYSNDGITWTSSTNIFSGGQGYGVAGNGTRWIALGGGTSHAIAYSDDGITWIGRGLSPFLYAYGAAWNGTIWVAVGESTHTIAYSNDGITWTGLGKTIFSNLGWGVAWNGTRWIAVGSGTSHTIAYSDNGTTWTGLSKATFATQGYGIAGNGTRWVAVGLGTNSIAYSDNGITWTGVTLKTIFSTNGYGVAWNGTIWVAVGNGTSHSIAYSNDGIIWTGLGTTILFQGYGVAWNGTRWVAVGGGGTNSIVYSDNGILWTGLGASFFPSSGAGLGIGAASYTIGTVTSYTANLSITGPGTINTYVTQDASGNYAAITYPVAAGTVNVQGSPTITPDNRSVAYPTTTSITVTPTSTSTGAFAFSLQAGFPAGTSINSTSGVLTIGGLGTIVVLVTQAASGIYSAITTPTVAYTITVAAPTAPTISPNNRTVTYPTTTSLPITPTSTSTGAFAFSLQAGFPAGTSIDSTSGVLTIGGLGTIVVLVTQAASGIYSAITTPVVGGTITVTNGKIITITPTSDSPGAFTYSLDASSSAIATINSSTGLVTITGGGTINVYVTQDASGNYAAVTTPVLAGSIISLPVPGITPAATQNATYLQTAKKTVTPTSDSTGAFTYSLQPGYLGCTTVDPNTGVVTIGGTGTITVLVTQAATSNYGPVTTPVLAGTIISDFSPIPCFKENTLILTVDGYRPIQDLRKGDLVKTVNHGYVGINMIGCKIIYNRKETIFFDKIYKCSNDNYPEIFEDLYITGLHAVLVDELTDEQLTQIKCVYNDSIFITDNKCRLPVCFDERATPHNTDEDEEVVIFHLALDHENENLNYGIYANGLLVETTSIGLIKESGLIMVE